MLTQNQTPTRLSRLYSSLSARVAEDDSDVIDVVARNLNRSMSASFDGEFESLSAPRKRAAAETSPVRAKNLKKESEDQQGSTLERLLVVQYPTNPEEEVEWEKYNKIFFATNNSAAKAKGITRNDYLSVAEYLAQQAFYVNAALSLFRYIALNAGRIAASESPAVQVGVNWGLYTTGFNPKIATEAAVGMLNACAQGNSHIIRKVPGAYVLMFTGIPGFGLAHGKSTEINAPVLDSGDAYTKALLSPEGALSTKIGSAAVKAAQYILDSVSEVSDSTSFSNSTRRIVSMVPLKEAQAGGIISYAFSMFRKITGIEMPKIEIPNPSSALVNGVGTYLSALVIKEANDSLVRRKINAKGTVADSELGHAPQLEAINGSVSYSIAMTIPESIARYISQSLPGERVSLVALNTWASVWASGMLTHGRKQKGTRINGKFIRNLPRYVLPASKTKELTQRRKEVGYYTEPGKGNDENIFIANNGTLQYLPKADDLMLDNAAAYEKVLEEALATSFNAGAPLNTSAQRPADPVFDLQHPGYADAVSSLKRRLDAYQGSVQSFSWDYNVILTTSVAQSDRIVATSLNGSTKPNAMFIADYMRKPFADSMALMFPHAIGEDGDRVDASSFGKDLRTCSGMLNTTPFKGVFELYDYLVNEEAIAPFEALLKDAAAELKIKDLTDGPHAEYERGLYTAVVSNTLTVTGGTRDEFGLERKPSWFVRAMLEAAIKDAEAHPRSNLAKAVFDRNQRDGSSDTPEDDPHYFHAGSMTLREFSNVFSYLGGRVFQLLLKALTKVDRKHFMVVNDNSDLKLPPFTSIVSEIMPLATMFATYVPNYEKVYEAADLVIESNTPDDSFTADDIHLPGSGPKFQLFPHQVQGFSQLSRFPAFAILDVSPGGGKTTTILTDIGMMIHNNKAKRFLVLCPTRLAKNWIEDMRKHTKDNWNFIPINTAVYKKWGEEKLSALIENAPRNTIVVVGNDWLSKTGSKQLVIGRHVERISTTAEMIKRFGFDYVAIDESHRMKRMHPTPSNVHRIVKSITTSSSVKYLRLATGTLINNVLMDVVGQAALYSSAIFRTPDEFEAANKELGVGLGGRRSLVYMNTAAKKAREHLSKYATVITTRRREWAFMLPIPKDTFVFVSLSESDEAGNAVNPADDAHRMMYEALFNSTLEDIKGNPELMSMLMGKKDIDGDDEEDEEEADDETKNKVISAALAQAADDQDEDTLEELSEALTPYLQRLEQSIVDPLGDRDAFGNEFGSVFFKGINHENYVSAKVRKIIERIDKHYQQFPWAPGKQWSKDDLCDHQGKRYMFVGKPGARSITAPSEDTENWKPQAYGKVLVFCRYIRSVEAIYKALPSKYKSLARRFHGSAANAWEGLEEFKTGAVATPEEVNSGSAKGVQIFIANEQAITEGHNLQMASRMVRVEMPWAPGDLDQSSARIFRPDPSGKFARDFINLDWVIGNGTLEVAKLGCLVSKILTKAQFDEADNDFKATDADGNEFGYGDLNKANLPTIKMSLKNIENIRWAEDLQEFSPDGTKLDYLDEYRKFVQLQGADFLHMRKTRTAHMIDIEPTPMPKDAKKLEFQPYVSAQKVVGHDDWGLVLLSEYLQNDSDPEAQPYIADKKLLKGKFVHTEFGNGVIIGTRTTNASGKKAASSEDEGDPQTRLSSVRVQLAGTNEVITLDSDVVHLARTLDAKQVKLFAPKDLWNKSEADRKRQEEAEEADRKKSARDARKVREEIDRERKEIKISRRIKDKAPIVKRGRQVEEAFEDDDTDQDVQPSVELNPVVYNGYIALEGVSDTEDEASVLKKFGFKPFGDYVYIKIPNWQTFDAVLSFLDKKFFLSDQIYNRLVKTEDSFTSGRGRKFDVDLAPVAEFKNFYILSHRKSLPKGANGKPELKVYPMIIGQNLFFVADMETNPVTRKLVGTSIPGATSKWGIADGMFISFFSTKAQLKAKALEIKKAGITIDNWSEFVTAYNELKVGKVQKSEKERVVREPVRKTAANKAVKAPVKAVPPKKAPLKQVATKAVKVPVKSAPKKAPVKKAAAAVKTPVKKATPTAASKKPVRR